jgi:hypothetical protein
MKKYKVTLQKDEREDLEAITCKGYHQSHRVVSVLVLLNCDEGEFNEYRMRGVDVANVLRISMRTIDRIKKRFVEDGLEAALGSRQGRGIHERKSDGDFEAHLVALSCSKPPQGFARRSLRLPADRVVELRHIDSVSHETIRRV